MKSLLVKIGLAVASVPLAMALLAARPAHAQFGGLISLDTQLCPTVGAIAVRQATRWKCVTPGVAGQVFVSGGAGAQPGWTTPVGTGNVNASGTPTANQIAVWTNSTTAQGVSGGGSLLDTVSALAGTGFLRRTAPGTYSASAIATGDLPASVSLFGNTAGGALLDSISGASSIGYVKRTGAGAYSYAAIPIGDLPTTLTNLGNTATGSGSIVLSVAPSFSGGTTTMGGATADKFTGTNAGPTWASVPVGMNDYFRYVLNGFPLNGEFSSATQNMVQGVVAAIDVPTGSNAFQTNSLASYARTAATAPYIVASYNQLTFQSNGSSPVSQVNSGSGDAGNDVCVNGPQQNTSNQNGVSPGNVACHEIDNNVLKVDATNIPFTNWYGLLIGGNSYTQTVGAFDAINIGNMGVQWKRAFATMDGSAAIGIQLGATATAASSNSQIFDLRARNSSNVQIDANLYEAASGAVIFGSGANNAGFILTDKAGTTILSLTPAGGSLAGQITVGQITSSSDVITAYERNIPTNVSTLTTNRPCSASTQGYAAYVTDLATNAYGDLATGGGGLKHTVVCNGTNYLVGG